MNNNWSVKRIWYLIFSFSIEFGFLIICQYPLYIYSLAYVHVGYPCSSHLQCNGTDFSGVCRDGRCHCQLGYLEIHEICYAGIYYFIENFPLSAIFQPNIDNLSMTKYSSKGNCRMLYVYFKYLLWITLYLTIKKKD